MITAVFGEAGGTERVNAGQVEGNARRVVEGFEAEARVATGAKLQ